MFLLKCSDLLLVLQGGIDHIEPIEQHCTVARSNGKDQCSAMFPVSEIVQSSRLMVRD